MSLVDIRVDLPSYSQNFTVKVPSSSSVSHLKQQIQGTCPGHPRPEGQRLIWRGRVLKDDESIESLWKADPRIVHLAVHPSAWSSPPPEIPQPPSLPLPLPQHIPTPLSSFMSPLHAYPGRPNPMMAQPNFPTNLTPTYPRLSLEYVRYIHQKALSLLSSAIPTPVEDSDTLQQRRFEDVQTLARNGWTWPAVLDEPFPEPTQGGLAYIPINVDGQFYLQLSNTSGSTPTPSQEHAFKVLSYTLHILSMNMAHSSITRITQPQQLPGPPPHVNQLLQQHGLPPLRAAGNHPIPANQNNALLADLREIPIRPLLAPLMMLLLRTLLLLYFFAPARKPIFGILILGWMLYEIWQPIRNGLRNGWGRLQDNGQRQPNNNVQNGAQAPGAAPPNGPQQAGIRPVRVGPAGPVTLEAQAAQLFDILANLNIEDEQRMLNPGAGPAAEPTLGHKIVTFVSLFITTLHPAIWNRRRTALRRREGVVRTEANVRNAAPPTADSSSEATPSPADEEAARRQEQLRAAHERQPRWIQRYTDRVVAEEWVDDSD